MSSLETYFASFFDGMIQCATCLVHNPEDKTNCLSCDSELSSDQQPPLKAYFANIYDGKIQCTKCLAHNEESATKCVCCKTLLTVTEPAIIVEETSKAPRSPDPLVSPSPATFSFGTQNTVEETMQSVKRKRVDENLEGQVPSNDLGDALKNMFANMPKCPTCDQYKLNSEVECLNCKILSNSHKVEAPNPKKRRRTQVEIEDAASEQQPPLATVFANLYEGKVKCPTCCCYNAKSATKCVICESTLSCEASLTTSGSTLNKEISSPTLAGCKRSYEGSDDPTAKRRKVTHEREELEPLTAVFANLYEGKIQCPTCCTYNGKSETKCVCCESTLSTEDDDEAEPLAAVFANLYKGKIQCTKCLVYNAESSTKCSSCEASLATEPIESTGFVFDGDVCGFPFGVLAPTFQPTTGIGFQFGNFA